MAEYDKLFTERVELMIQFDPINQYINYSYTKNINR